MTDDSDDGGTADTMRGRADESGLRLWLLLEANRLLVTAVLSAIVFVAFVIAVSLLSPPFTEQIASGDTIETMFSGMITVIVTGTTLVVTIGQLVLTQENGPLGDQRDRMSNSMDVREFVSELIGEPCPADPSAFLDELVGVSDRRARALRDAVDESDDELREDVDAFVDSVVGNAASVSDQLDGARFGTFDVLSAGLDFNYSYKVQRLERLEADYDDRLTEQQRTHLGELKRALTMFGPAREHVKTLYFQWALIDLSRLILYAAVPALLVAGIMLAVVDGGTVPGATFGLEHAVLVVGAAFSVTLVPFMLFLSYLLRVLTVAKRTLAIEPLILRDSQR